MMDVIKAKAETKLDDSRLNPLSRMLKQPRANVPPPAKAPRKAAPQVAAPAELNPKPAATTAATIGAALTIKGDVTGKGDVFVSGKIEGTIDLPGNDVTVEASGRVDGSIAAKRVRVMGKVVGDIGAPDKITINSTGTVQGTISAPRIEVEDGAKFKGRIDMDFDAASCDAPVAVSLSNN